MTNELAHYSEIMEWCRESEKGQRSNNSRYVKAGVIPDSRRRCMYCKRELVNSPNNCGTFCNSSCVNAWNSEKGETLKRIEKFREREALANFSNIINS